MMMVMMVMMMMENDENDDDDGDDDDDDGGDADDICISAYLPEDSPPSRYSAMAEGGSYCLLSCVIHSCRTRGIVFFFTGRFDIQKYDLSAKVNI
jgi:hypothetical protein